MWKYTKEHIDYVRSIAAGRYNDEIAEMFNDKFNLDKTPGAINSLKANHKIVSGKLPRRSRPAAKLFTDEQEKFLRDNVPGIYNAELQKRVNERFNLQITSNQIKGWKARNKVNSGLTGRFVEGQESWNKGRTGIHYPGSEKGWFTKGQDPVNHRVVGSERITKDGYIEIKTAEPSTWRLKHVVEWEKHNGLVPDRHAIIYLDSDRLNTNIKNLKLITRGELARMNQSDLFSIDPEITMSGIHIMRLSNRLYELNLHGGNEAEYLKGIKIAANNGISNNTYVARLKRGWSLHDAMNKPLHHTFERVTS